MGHQGRSESTEVLTADGVPPELFPMFLRLRGRRVLVVGGGVVAASKVGALRAAGASVKVVAPEVVPEIAQLPLEVHRRGVSAADLDDAWLVISAATPTVNRWVARLAESRRLFVNAVDDPPNASAYLGGVLRRDGVTVAISTNGRAPALAGLLREGLDQLLPDTLSLWMAQAERLRQRWRASAVPMEQRRPALLDVLVRTHGPLVGPPFPKGGVSLVGAGPGSAEHLTQLAVRRLREADVVFHDGLVPQAIVDLATTAERLSVARRAGVKCLTQHELTRMLIAAAREGRRVVRLKAGDPFVFGRGGEEAQGLAEAGVPVEVVPGVSSATAAPASAGIPLTHRGHASAFVVVSGHSPTTFGPVLSAVPPDSATVVVLMGMGQRLALRECLLATGWSPQTPSAIVSDVMRPSQRSWTGPLVDLADASTGADSDAPGVIVIGSVVATQVTLAGGPTTHRGNV